MPMELKKQELEDLILSFIVLTLIFSNFELTAIPYVALGIFTAFVFHEIAHRQVARKYGYYAIYRRWDTGIMLALLLGILNKLLGFGFIFAAVGAVQVYSLYAGWEDRKIYGKISLAGPVTNILIGTFALILLLLGEFSGTLWASLYYTTVINLWLAFFNLLPIPPLDGYKVLRWNPGYWGVAIGMAFLLQSII
ncbi:MAG: site-2 protease family protein [Methanomassiliicoccales archaeon]|uniref:Metalloprotease n=2 Tax=Thermococcus sibiricus TaxID=172049 RepID=A0A124FFI8_9EURY|nr:site-2 protease family protein [Thermococcus sibiricus]KUK18251.1 MAG: Metalloprotease [Thermococcus sibiricus]MBC7108965.1 site-2 protease family protein [Methanomassiliicoccales archaeon]